jgi:hypothetical protein
VVRIWDRGLSIIRSIGLYAHSVANFLDPEMADGMYWVSIFSGLEEVRIRGGVDERTREQFRELRWRMDGRSVQIVFEEE